MLRDSALACWESSVCIPHLPLPVLAATFLPSRDNPVAPSAAHSLCHKTQQNPGALLVCLNVPGSKRGWDKACSAVPLWAAETSKSGAGGTRWAPSEAHSELPTAPSFSQAIL